MSFHTKPVPLGFPKYSRDLYHQLAALPLGIQAGKNYQGHFGLLCLELQLCQSVISAVTYAVKATQYALFLPHLYSEPSSNAVGSLKSNFRSVASKMLLYHALSIYLYNTTAFCTWICIAQRRQQQQRCQKTAQVKKPERANLPSALCESHLLIRLSLSWTPNTLGNFGMNSNSHLIIFSVSIFL